MKKSRVGLDISGRPEDSPEKVREGAFPEREKLFSLVFRLSPAAMGISRLSDGRFIEVNDAFLQIYGYSREEIIGHNSDELGLWLDPEQRARVVASLREHGQARDLEMKCRRKSGEIGDLLASAEIIELDGEECFLSTFFDITRRKKIEETFRENERRYRAVVEDQTEVICRLKSDGTIKFVNDVYCRSFGKTEEELLGKRWHPIAVPEDIPMIEEQLALLSPANPVVVIENRVYSGPGEIRWMQFVNRGLYDGQGRLLEIQAVGRDITERKEAEDALHRSEAKYRALFENSLDAIFLTVPDGTIKAANRAACEMFGLTEEELIRAGRSGIIDPADRRFTSAVGKRARNGRFFGELTYRRKDGTKFPAETSSVIMDDGYSSFVILRDISERKQAEQELLDRQQKINSMAMGLSVAEEKERCLIAEQLHDQIAPKLFLTKMKVHSLIDRLPPGDYGPAMDAVDALIDLGVEDIRSLTFQLRPPILADVGLEAALRWLGEEFNENYGLQVQIEDDKKVKPLKYELRSAIFQIVRELLMNIAKHAGTKNATICIKREKETIIVMVEDNGVGFDVENSSLIKPRSGGFGIFNTRMKIEYLGGELSIVSSPGQGTRVSIRAPLDTTRTRTEK
jgi:two-component system, NarL family, sensor histidine kinase UhpB